jgi:hypothetical protein
MHKPYIKDFNHEAHEGKARRARREEKGSGLNIKYFVTKQYLAVVEY